MTMADMKNWRCTIEIEKGLYFVRDWMAPDEDNAKAIHLLAYVRRFKRRDAPKIDAVLIDREGAHA